MIEQLTKDLVDIGVQYMGLCCGNRAYYIRKMAETLGRQPPASKYSTNMTQHLSQVQGDANAYSNQNWHKTFGKNCDDAPVKA